MAAVADDLDRLRKVLRLAISTDNDGEAGAAYSMVRATLKRMGHDVHWLADQIGGARSNGSAPPQGAVDAAYQRGFARGRAEGLAEGGLRAWARGDANGGHAWSPGADPAQWNEPDPVQGARMPPQRWAAWLLARRRQRLSEWETGFCESVVRWRGDPTPKQKTTLEGIVHKVR